MALQIAPDLLDEPQLADEHAKWLHYQRWVARHMPSGDELYRQKMSVHRLPYRPLISIVVPVFNTPPEMLRGMLRSVSRQTYSNWQLCLVDDGSAEPWIARTLSRLALTDSRVRFARRAANGGISAATNDAIAMATGEFVQFIDHDDDIDPRMLHAAVRQLNARPGSDIVHYDLDLLMPHGRRSRPLFLPEWSPELLLASPYLVHLLVRRSCLDAVGPLRSELDGGQDYDLALRLVEVTDRIVHIPEVFYHWRVWAQSASSGTAAKPYAYATRKRSVHDALRRRGIAGEIVDNPQHEIHRIRFDVIDEPLVSIVVPLAGHSGDSRGEVFRGAIARRLRRLIEVTAYRRVEILLVESRTSFDDVTLQLDVDAGTRVAHLVSDTADSGEMVNCGARTARGQHLLVLAPDVDACNGEWLSSLIEYSQQTPIGAVGAQVFRADGTLWHAGVILPRGEPVAVRQDLLLNPGELPEAVHVANFSAVSGGCLMTRRAVFEEVGGFRPAHAVGFSDVDYCLRLRQHGRRIVFTPLSRLRLGGQSRVLFPQSEMAAFRQHWSDYVDPYYNPNLSPDGSFLAHVE